VIGNGEGGFVGTICSVRKQDNVSFTFVTTILEGVIDVFGQLHPLNLIILGQKKYGWHHTAVLSTPISFLWQLVEVGVVPISNAI